MKIGLIYCSFNTESYVEPSLRPWIDARASRLDGYDYVICAISVPFIGFEVDKMDGTQDLLRGYKARDDIDCLIAGESTMHETDARGAALKWLMEQGCDTSILVDSDEMWEVGQITRVFQFVAARPLLAWFKICYKNYVFDTSTFLVEPFCPPRIHRLRLSNCQAIGFWDDNNVEYRDDQGRRLLDRELPHVTIPKSVTWVKHLSWLSDERGRAKTRYQATRQGWTCSFVWDDSQNRLVWNPVAGLPPEISHD